MTGTKFFDGFSNKQKIGRGGFAVVYKGKLQNRIVAVKRMSDACMDETVFHREVQCLMMAKHKNIVRFLGYCANRQGIMDTFEGKLVMADVHQRLLCFEYLPKGSLHEYITDTTRGLQWRDRFCIITGICHGLHYLHQKNIVHLGLKPANILLDNNLVAKIADFGLSRCFGEMQSRIITLNIYGTLGYFPPEFCNGEITYQFDIFSLGVIIMEILTGKKGCDDVDKVVESWSNMLEKSQRGGQLEQVRVCAQIGIECTDSNPAMRPSTQDIINRLDGTETIVEYIKTSVITSQPAIHALTEMHQGISDSLGETRSKENVSEFTMAGTNPCNSIWESTSNLDKLSETMDSRNPDTRRCFKFCSIFPKGSKLRRGELVRLWIAQGYVKTSCATDDLEDIAEGYIQELVLCSFLQPIGTSSVPVYFTIHDVLHDMLDKAAGNCFRIENASSPRGQGWEGDVPQGIQHLLIQNYDGELIIETIIGLEYLRSLIVYVVGKDTPIEKKVIENICKRLPKLRVLAVAFSHEHDRIKELSVPKSIGQLKYLRYLSFRAHNRWKITLPSTLNTLEHIQLLDFGRGNISGFTFHEIVSLRHIFCHQKVKLPYVGRLSSLQTLSGFRVSPYEGLLSSLPGFKGSIEQGCDLKQLRDLNNLRGKINISGLQNVKSKGQSLEANLGAKQLTALELSWDYFESYTCNSDVATDVLEGLCPPMGLQMLKITNFVGLRYPDWMVGKHSGGPKHLQKLSISQCIKPVPASGLAQAFPHLSVLSLSNLRAFPDNMEHLTSLKELNIEKCHIRLLPLLPPSLEKFTLLDCSDVLMVSCQTVRSRSWQKIEHIPQKYIRPPLEHYIGREEGFGPLGNLY